MKYSNKDIIKYYRKMEFDKYSGINPEIIQFDDHEIKILRSLLYDSSNKRALVHLNLDYIENPESTKNFIRKFYNDVDEELLDNYINRNSKWTLIDKNIKINENVLWYEEYEMKNKLKNKIKEYIYGDSGLFSSYYTVSLSRIGFNGNKSKAMLEYGTTVAFLCGSGKYLFFERTGENWHIVNAIGSWIS